MVFCSGCVPMDPKTMKLVEGDIKDHTVRGVTISSDLCACADTQI